MESKNQNKQTAVEFLIEKWATQGTLYSSDMYQAKEMFEQQIKDACNAGLSGIPRSAEQYYNETFKQHEL